MTLRRLRSLRPLFFISLVLPAAGLAQAAPASAPVDTGDAHTQQTLIRLEPPEVAARRLEWWSEARFGMFIHWGLYAQEGSHWQGRDGKSEHMMRHLQLPLREYAKIADVFNPVRFDADAWAQTARDAGMRYVVITSKHHDGFAMFDTGVGDYSIVKRTPFRRDPIRELAVATRRAGLRFGVYYSLGRDWEDPDVPTRDGYRSNTWDYPDEAKKDFARYFERKVKPQVRELLTKYGPIAVLWFDTPEKISRAQSEELLRMIRELQPDCIVNQRIGNRLGDYRVAEQQIPAQGPEDPWEACMTLNRHWGYYAGDEAWKSREVVIRHLVDIASKGGNFLLNVGPTGEGVIPQGSAERLREVGAWLRLNGAAIHGTTAGPLRNLPWGRCTQKAGSNGTLFFLHVFDWPADGRLVVPGLKSRPRSARLLADGTELKCERVGDADVIHVPALAPDSACTTIEVRGSETNP